MLYFELSIIAALPVVVSVLFYTFFKNPDLESVSDKTKQIIAGFIFGLLAIAGTEFGVKVNNIVLNARDAAPLCAGLIFGPISGIMAGVIGGLERWFAVYWGAGTYTRLACSAATIISGIIAAMFKQHMFKDKLPSWYYSLAIGIVAETMHMLDIFITHLNDVSNAFEVVELCTIPMVNVNAIAVALAVFVVGLLDKKNSVKKKDKKISLSQQFQKGLLFVVVAAFIVTSTFNYVLQNRVSKTKANDVLIVNIDDVQDAIEDASNSSLIDKTRTIKNRVVKLDEITNEKLIELAEQYEVYEINIVDEKGYIRYSTNKDYINFNMNSGKQAREFLVLNEWTSEYIQDYQPITYDNRQSRKYAGIALASGFIQVGINEEMFYEEMDSCVRDVADNRHVGESGGIIVADSNGKVIAGNDEQEDKYLEEIGIVLDNIDEREILTTTFNDNGYYYSYIESEGYKIITYVPADEIDFTRDISIYLTTFMEIVVYAILFVVIFFVCEFNVVGNIQKVNQSLDKITNGNLDETINITNNAEFVSLSNGINTTVDSMKHLIDDANKRIDQELQYAKDIQFSALPQTFPKREEFDIYALMRPAKSVGGDFYDFYFIDDDTLALCVSDVSGKGIPAALFMMRSKSILKSLAESKMAVNDIYTDTNNQLCDGNTTGMFVTSWMGFLNLKTGELKFTNAGHNPPVIRRKGGEFEYLKSKVGFVLGGMEDIKYVEQTINLNEGDEIFLYTDGVVEATNKETVLYGDDRLKEALDKYQNLDATNMCKTLLNEVDNFVGEAPQFDDITMLSVKLKKLNNM